jgi:hypothetical protein
MVVSVDSPQFASVVTKFFLIDSIPSSLWFYSSLDALAIVGNAAGQPSSSYQVVSWRSIYTVWVSYLDVFNSILLWSSRNAKSVSCKIILGDFATLRTVKTLRSFISLSTKLDLQKLSTLLRTLSLLILELCGQW